MIDLGMSMILLSSSEYGRGVSEERSIHVKKMFNDKVMGLDDLD